MNYFEGELVGRKYAVPIPISTKRHRSVAHAKSGRALKVKAVLKKLVEKPKKRWW